MENKKFLCGFASVDVTPEGKMQLVGQFETRVASEAADPLTATVMAMSDGISDPVFWISLDILQIPKIATDAIAAAFAEAFEGFERGDLIISCIHNHTGPHLTSLAGDWGESYKVVNAPDETTPENYLNLELIPKLVSAAKRAVGDMKPAATASVLGHAVVGHCRRVKYRDGSEQMYGTSADYNFDRLEASPDNAIEWIMVYDEKGEELRGVVYNVWCPAQVVEHMSVYSADFAGTFRRTLWEKLGKEIPVLTIIGCAGNVSPRDLVRRGRGEPSMHSFEGCTEIAERLLYCFEHVSKKAAKCINLNPEFAHKFFYAPLPLRTVSRDELAEATAQYNAVLAKYDGDALKFTQAERTGLYRAAGIVARGRQQARSTLYYCPVHAMRIGDTAIVSNPFELYIEYGLRMVARSAAEHTMTAQLTDDDAGYLPTPEAVAGGSYSTYVASCTVSSEGGELLTEMSIQKMNELF